ncbi:hypothetical protein N0V90_005828 [Kalmusia sp. IMI 367209]|nr:hypothetical protein N0V90_005828 [Kalmusia sp. IMI 367209]
MKLISITHSLLFTSLSVAAPSPALHKRVAASITLYTEQKFTGQSYTVNFDIPEGDACVAPTLPDAFDAKTSSLLVTNDYGNWYCQLYRLDFLKDTPTKVVNAQQ